MEKENFLNKIKEEMGGNIPEPIKNLAEIDLDFLKSHLAQKKDAYSGDKLDMKTKALVALGVGIALDSSSCILNNVKAARKFGASKDEIMGAFKVAKFSKSATILSNSNLAFEWLKDNMN